MYFRRSFALLDSKVSLASVDWVVLRGQWNFDGDGSLFAEAWRSFEASKLVSVVFNDVDEANG